MFYNFKWKDLFEQMFQLNYDEKALTKIPSKTERQINKS